MATTIANTHLSSETLMTCLEEALDGIFILDTNRQIVFFNKSCEQITGYDRSEVLGSHCTCQQLLQCEDEQGRSLVGRLCPGLQVFEGRAPKARHRVLIRRKDGRKVWIEATYTPIKDLEGRVVLVLAVMRDITQTKRREDEIRESAEAVRKQLQQYQAELAAKYGFDQLVGRTDAVQKALDKARTACQSDLPVLITGEPGTGKATLAKLIHYHSARQNGPLVIGSCSAIEPQAIEATLFGTSNGRKSTVGWLQSANGGTLYLQDIDALPAALQLNLAQLLQSRSLPQPSGAQSDRPDIRLIASTRSNADIALSNGRLKPELYYAISVIRIDLPPLRERTEDIPLLVQFFVERCNRTGPRQIKHISPRAWSVMLSYEWPGNIRELQHAIESAYANGKGDILRAEDLPPTVKGEQLAIPGIDEAVAATSLDEILEQAERRAILAALRRAKGRRSLAARMMGISRSRLYRRMEALGITPPQK